MHNISKWVIGTSVLWLSVVSSISSAQQIQQIDRLAVFDVNQNRVGPVVGTEDQGGPSPGVWFSFEINNSLVTLGVEAGGNNLFGMLVNTLFFESADCSGPPLVRKPSGLWLLRFMAGGPNPGNPGGGGDNIIYLADRNASELNGGSLVMFGSSAHVTSPDCDSPSTDPSSNNMIPAQVVLDIDAVFTRPFHVEKDVTMAGSNGPQSYDLNGDGKADLVWRHKGNGSVGVWLMNGTTIDSTAVLGGVPFNWEIAQVADLNGDGKADLVWRNMDNGDVGVWLMDGVNAPTTKDVVKSSVPLVWEIQP